MDTHDKLLEVAAILEKEAANYLGLSYNGFPTRLREEWGGISKGLERAVTVLFGEAYRLAKEQIKK